jgi:hypothetical protein
MTEGLVVLMVSIATAINAFTIIGLRTKLERTERALRQLERRVG